LPSGHDWRIPVIAKTDAATLFPDYDTPAPAVADRRLSIFYDPVCVRQRTAAASAALLRLGRHSRVSRVRYVATGSRNGHARRTSYRFRQANHPADARGHSGIATAYDVPAASDFQYALAS